MEIQNLANLLDKQQTVSPETVEKLGEICNRHPYFHLGKILYLKGLKDTNNFKYNKTLKEAAALTTDRTVLFDFISDFPKRKKALQQTETIVTSELTSLAETTNTVEELEIGAPLEFGKNETHSFAEWLQLSSPKTIQREKSNSEKIVQKKQDLIDLFLKNNPKISATSKDYAPEIPTSATLDKNDLMTETLAKVYLEQKKYKNAIKAYEILILKYPEKSGFFADQIKKIEFLKNNKT